MVTGTAQAQDATSPPHYVYAGVDYAFLRSSLSKDSMKNALGGDQFDSDFYLLRVGTRLFKQISIEGRFGIKNESGNSTDKVETNQMYGIYIVPTGNLFHFLEVSAPIGYAHTKLENDNGSVKLNGMSFGLNFEVPIYVNAKSRIPDIRLSSGGTVYYAGRDSQTYGYQAGIRMDFKI
ncbi:outer membrane beta-barrel protein [Solimonas marina]|nr:outer membrane beta-barrel protein [Solimonas marina]